MLNSREIVIGPCYDGGYYLIGMNQMHRDIFEGISWSTSQVYAQTLTKVTQLGISVRRLRRLRDIDTGEDLHQWAKTAIAPGNRTLGKPANKRGYK